MQNSRRIVIGLVALIGGIAPTTARADVFAFWAALRGDVFGGTSDLFTEFDSPAGGGLEVGLELMNVTLFADALFMGSDQFLFSGNLGMDFSFGQGTRFGVGLFTGPILFMFPEEETSSVNFTGLTADEQTALLEIGGYATLDEAEADFDAFSEEEKDLGALAFGWNLARLRLSGDMEVAPLIYVGLAGQVGYHMLISGDDVAAGAKNQALEKYAAQYGLDVNSDLFASIREVVGAEPVDSDNLDGFNFDGNLFLRIEF